MTHAYNGIQWIAILVHVIVLFFAIIFHEIAHGYVAYLCGDPTAKNAGRLTLNPLAHIDPFGSVILPAICAILGFKPSAGCPFCGYLSYFDWFRSE